jgi:hypothetical protein
VCCCSMSRHGVRADGRGACWPLSGEDGLVPECSQPRNSSHAQMVAAGRALGKRTPLASSLLVPGPSTTTLRGSGQPSPLGIGFRIGEAA